MTTKGAGRRRKAVRPAAVPGGELATALIALRNDVARARFGVMLDGADAATKAAAGLVAQLDDYILPRLGNPDAPLLAVVGGSTGVGKSTVVNSLVRAVVSPAGVLRPTTRSPVLVVHPDDAPAFASSRVLSSLPRAVGVHRPGQGLGVVTVDTVHPGLAFLDAPDLGSVLGADRDLAARLIGAADLCVFVTTAARYADAAPWELLREAVERRTAVAVVLNRVPPAAQEKLIPHVQETLGRHGLAEAALFAVPESTLADGLLPETVLAPAQKWFHALAGSAQRRNAVVRQTLGGMAATLPARVSALVAAAETQLAFAVRMQAAVTEVHAEARTRAQQIVAGGAAFTSDVLSAWREFAGAAEPRRAPRHRPGAAKRDVLVGLRARRGGALRVALESALVDQLTAVVDRAANDTVAAWRRIGHRPPDEPVPTSRDAVHQAVGDWQREVLDASGAGIGEPAPTATGLLAMVLAVVGPDRSRLDVPVDPQHPRRTPVPSPADDETLRPAVETARADLVSRVNAVLASSEARHAELVRALTPEADLPDRLAAALERVEAAVQQALPAQRAPGSTAAAPEAGGSTAETAETAEPAPAAAADTAEPDQPAPADPDGRPAARPASEVAR